MRYCHACGKPNGDDARFCESCGAAMAGPAAAPQPAASAATSLPGREVLEAVKRVEPKVMAAVVAGVVLLVAAYVIFLRPMSEAQYDELADKYVHEVFEAHGDVNTALQSYHDYDESYEPDNKVDKADWQATTEDIDEALGKIKKATKGIRGLRPPKDYKSADERLNRWADFWGKEYPKRLKERLGEIDPGDKYSQADSHLDRFDSAIGDDMSRSWNHLSKASEDVSLNLEGE